MKLQIELNGIQNLISITEMALQDGKIDKETSNKLRQQIDHLHRYMVTLKKRVERDLNNCQELGIPPVEPVIPYWHEVRDNPEDYPID